MQSPLGRWRRPAVGLKTLQLNSRPRNTSYQLKAVTRMPAPWSSHTSREHLVCLSRIVLASASKRGGPAGRDDKYRGPKRKRGRISKGQQNSSRSNHGDPSKHRPSLHKCLQQVKRLPPGDAPLTDRRAPCLFMKSFEFLEKDSIGEEDAQESLDAINLILSHAKAGIRQAALLSHLGKALQKQPALQRVAENCQEFQSHIPDLFSHVSAKQDLFSNVVSVSQLATAQLKIGYYSPAFWKRVELEGLTGLPERQLANVVHASVKVHSHFKAPMPSQKLRQGILDALAANDHGVVSDMTAQHVPNVMWSLAKVGLVPCSATINALLVAVNRVAPMMNPQDVANAWWALPLLGVDTNAPVYMGLLQPSLQEATCRVSGTMKPQEVASIWLSVAKLGLAVPESVSAALLGRTGKVVYKMTEQEVSNTWLGLATLGITVDPDLAKKLLSATKRILLSENICSQYLANILWAFGVVVAMTCDTGDSQQQEPPGDRLALCDQLHMVVAADIKPALESFLQDSREHMFLADIELRWQVHHVSDILQLRDTMGPEGQRFLALCHGACEHQAAEQSLASPGSASMHAAVLKNLENLPDLKNCLISSEAVVGDGSRSVDILVKGNGVRVAVEVDGPWHFLRDSSGQVVRENGSTVLRNWQLRHWGYDVLSVCVVDKTPDELRSKEHAEWLLSELQDRGVLGP